MIKELHYFALAVAQAGSFIHCCPLSLSEYRELYQRERNNLLQNEETQGRDPYELAVFSTWRLSYEKLEGPARSLLQICSFLHHEGISEDMFQKAALSKLRLNNSKLQDDVTKLLNQLGKKNSGWSSWNFKQVTRRLGSYSLIEYDTQNRTYSIHPLVYHWSGTTMEGNRRDMQKIILTIIGLSVSYTFTEEDYKYRRTLLKHAINSMASFKPEDIDLLIAAHIGLIYFEQGCWKEAEALGVAVMEKKKQVLGDDHPDTLLSMANLACTYGNQGQLKDAEALEVVVLEKRKRMQGDDHPATLMSMANLACTYSGLGQLKDAEALQMVVLGKSKRVLGDDHPNTITSMANLACIYSDQGQLKDAEALQVMVLEKRKRVLGDDNLDTITSMANLASTYFNQGRLDDAEALDVGVLEKKRRVLGDDHPHTLIAKENYADRYGELERCGGA